MINIKKCENYGKNRYNKKEVIDFVGKKTEKSFIKHLTKLFDKELKKIK